MESFTLYDRAGQPAITVNPQGNIAVGPGITTAQVQQLAQPEAAMSARLRQLEQMIRHLLLSADATWETHPEHHGGHDWAEACDKARALLGYDPRVAGYY